MMVVSAFLSTFFSCNSDGRFQGFVATWDIDKNAVLSNDFVKSPRGAGMPFSLTRIDNPHREAYLVADPVVGYNIYDFTNREVATIVDAPPIPGNNATCWSTFSKETGNFYLIDAGGAIVTEVNVDQNLKPTVVKVSFHYSGGSEMT